MPEGQFGIIYSPEEIEIDLFYSPDFNYINSYSYDDKSSRFSGEAAENNYKNVNNSNDRRMLAKGRRAELGERRAERGGISSFTDYLVSSNPKVVAGLRIELRTHGFSVRCSTG